jgi:hypothetical protein
MTPGQQAALAKSVARIIKEHVGKAFTSLRERIEALELAQKNFRYRGVWQPAETYAKGNLATYDGSLWIAIDDAPSKPGVSGWQLAAKRGADAR